MITPRATSSPPAVENLRTVVEKKPYAGASRAGAVEKGGSARDSEAESSLKEPIPGTEVQFRELSIRVSPETNRVVIMVIDAETKTVVREIPPDRSLDLLRQMPKRRALFVDRQG